MAAQKSQEETQQFTAGGSLGGQVSVCVGVWVCRWVGVGAWVAGWLLEGHFSHMLPFEDIPPGMYNNCVCPIYVCSNVDDKHV